MWVSKQCIVGVIDWFHFTNDSPCCGTQSLCPLTLLGELNRALLTNMNHSQRGLALFFPFPRSQTVTLIPTSNRWLQGDSPAKLLGGGNGSWEGCGQIERRRKGIFRRRNSVNQSWGTLKAILESGSFRASFGSQWGGGCAKRGQARVAVDLLWAAGRRVVSIVSFIHKKWPLLSQVGAETPLINQVRLSYVEITCNPEILFLTHTKFAAIWWLSRKTALWTVT